jgi:putative two-component system response regulator
LKGNTMNAVNELTSVNSILIVDDTPENLAVLGELLRTNYRVRVAPSGTRALQVAMSDPRPDLILLDVMMPDMDGYEVLRRLRADSKTADIPVIFVTAMDSADDEEHGFDLGAVDYITKPIKPAIVLARVHAHLELKQARDWLKDQNAFLEAEVDRRMRDNQLIQDVSIRALASLAETRDTETGNHIRRTQYYVEILARHLQHHPRFAAHLKPTMLRMIVKAAPLHDIGKVGIPDHILLKPGRLSADEFEVMKTHSRIGGDAIDEAMRSEMTETDYAALRKPGDQAGSPAASDLEGVPLGFLAVAKDIALCHHEKWDGSGYPMGLAGEAIPVSARIMAISDVFDALTSRRIYKPPTSLEESVEIIRQGRGRHFDPDIVDAFLTNFAEFKTISERYADTEFTLEEKMKQLRAETGL